MIKVTTNTGMFLGLGVQKLLATGLGIDAVLSIVDVQHQFQLVAERDALGSPMPDIFRFALPLEGPERERRSNG